jgi:hypothetical protein
MCAERTLLWYSFLFVPIDDPIRAGRNEAFLAYRLLWINQHDPIGSPVDCAIQRRLNTGGVITVHTRHWRISHLYFWIPPPLFLKDPHPKMAGIRLRCRIGRKIISTVLVPTRQKTVMATITLRDVYDHSIPRHFLFLLFRYFLIRPNPKSAAIVWCSFLPIPPISRFRSNRSCSPFREHS